MYPVEAALSITLLLFLRPCSCSSSTKGLEKMEFSWSSQLTCAQVLTDCRVKDEIMQHPPSGPVRLARVELKPMLCCMGGTQCLPCVKMVTHLTLIENGTSSEQQDLSGDSDDDSDANNDEGDGFRGVNDEYYNVGREEGSISGPDAPPALPMVTAQPAVIPLHSVWKEPDAILPSNGHSHVSLSVCYGIPNLLPVCKRVDFTVPPVGQEDQDQLELWFSLVMLRKVSFSSQVKVWVHLQNFSLILPSKEEVCSSVLRKDVAECDVPVLRTAVDWDNEVVTLQLDNHNTLHPLDVGLNIRYSELNMHSYQQWNGVEKITIPLTSVVPCTCFQVWWIQNDSLQVKTCPFINHTELLRNLWDNISVSMSPSETQDDFTVLTWAVSAPCRLDAELWPCWATPGEGGRCREVTGKRQQLRNEHQKSGWFSDLQPHPSLCVQITVRGKNVDLGPFCPLAAARSRWSLVLLFTIITVFMGILVVYLVRGSLKSWATRWVKGSDIRGTVTGGQVVLLCPPDPDPHVATLVCQLGASLSQLGFCVSLDLWSSTELGALGPVPWLHSRLHHLQCHGGKVVLLMTRTAWQCATQWALSEPQNARQSPPHADVFSASLSCILADNLQGCAGKRFVLAQFESLPPVPLEAGQTLPELFRGLALYSLPSQSLGFLTELAGAVGGRGQSRRRQAGSLRAGSRSLALGLRGLGQSRVGNTWEMVPLQCSNP